MMILEIGQKYRFQITFNQTLSNLFHKMSELLSFIFICQVLIGLSCKAFNILKQTLLGLEENEAYFSFFKVFRQNEKLLLNYILFLLVIRY